RLLDHSAARQDFATIEYPNIIQSEKAALKDVVAVRVLAVHPPREVEKQLMKGAFQEAPVPPPGVPFFDLVDPPHRPSVNRRIRVGKVPLVSGELPVGMHVPFAQQ